MFDRTKATIGFHTLVATPEGIDSLIRLIREGLAPRGFNLLIAEMRFQFKCFPEYSSGTITAEDASRLADVCEELGIKLVPLWPCLGHQSDSPAGTPLPLLQQHYGRDRNGAVQIFTACAAPGRTKAEPAPFLLEAGGPVSV